MTRSQLEHIIRASAAILSAEQFIVVGSQSILGTHPNPPRGLLTESSEADLYPVDNPERADILTATIGENSRFHDAFGVYADGVGPTTSKLPDGWRDRLVRLQNENTNGATGWCLDPTDLAIAKHVAGRGKDIAFTREMVRYGLIDHEAFLERLQTVDIAPEHREIIRHRFLGQVDGRDENKPESPSNEPKGGRLD